jgi:hypothetical protein
MVMLWHAVGSFEITTFEGWVKGMASHPALRIMPKRQRIIRNETSFIVTGSSGL